MTIEAILRERDSTHGDFSDVAAMEQNLFMTMEAGVNWKNLTAVQRSSLRMVQHKISRILSGNPNHKDHWDDIGGYAKLSGDRIAESKCFATGHPALDEAITNVGVVHVRNGG